MNRIVLLVILSACVVGQNATPNPGGSPPPNPALQVEIRTDKSSYTSGEPIRFTTILRNKGTASVYIANSFFQSGGGIAGFDISVRQLTGKPSAACPVFGDRYGPDPRTPKEILHEDFLLLQPGGIVGYEAEYKGCGVQYEGTYQMTASYCACDLNTDKVKSVAERAYLVTGELTSKPWTFHVIGKRRGK